MKVVCDTSVVPGIRKRQLVTSVKTTLDSQLENLELLVTSDYYSGFGRRTTPSFKVDADEYLLGTGKRWSDPSLLCPEMPLPRNLSDAVQLSGERDSISSDRAVALVHAGRKGCITPIHFDWDHTWVAHACLTGRKRFFLFPPEAGWLLSPVINTSALAIPKFPENDRCDLFKKLGGREIILEAGQGILFPSMFWHGALYEEPSLSVSVRFEADVGGRPFAAVPRSWLLQRLVWRFFDNAYNSPARHFLSQYLKSFFGRTRTWKDRYRKVTHLSRTALLELGEERGAREWIGENFSLEVALASEELKIYYGKPDATKPHEKDRVSEVRKYLFRGIQGVSTAHQLLLSKYALTVRQGLPPKRGLVQIEQK